MDDITDDTGMILVGRNTRDNSQSTDLSGWTRPNSISLTTPNNQIVSANNPSALTSFQRRYATMSSALGRCLLAHLPGHVWSIFL